MVQQLLWCGGAQAKLSRGLVCEAEVEPKGTSQDRGTFARWEWVKEARKYFDLSSSVWRPWKENSACSSGLRLGKANGAGWHHYLSWMVCMVIRQRRSCTSGGPEKSPGFGMLKAIVF